MQCWVSISLKPSQNFLKFKAKYLEINEVQILKFCFFCSSVNITNMCKNVSTSICFADQYQKDKAYQNNGNPKTGTGALSSLHFHLIIICIIY